MMGEGEEELDRMRADFDFPNSPDRIKKNILACRQRRLYMYLKEYLMTYNGFPDPTELKRIWGYIHYQK